MAVKVTVKNFEVDEFDGDDDMYWERGDGALEVYGADGKVQKIYVKGYWVAVEGKQKPDELLGF